MRPERRCIETASGLRIPSVWAHPPGAVSPGAPCVVLAPGAGAGMDHPFMTHVHEALPGLGIAAVKFDFPYRAAGGKVPDPPARLLETWRGVLATVRAELPGATLFPGGKSMGGRIASVLVAGGVAAAGLVLLGYPLQPAGRPQVTRGAHLARIRSPVLFIQGSRDPLCDLELLRGFVAGMPAAVAIHVVEGGDHSFKLLRSAGRSERAVWEEIVAVLATWVIRIASGPATEQDLPA